MYSYFRDTTLVRRKNAHDGVTLLVQRDRPVQHVRVAAKSALPEAVSENGRPGPLGVSSSWVKLRPNAGWTPSSGKKSAVTAPDTTRSAGPAPVSVMSPPL